MKLRVFAFGCHPDDIEFLMAGTLFLLKEAGAEIHYMNPANGCYGTADYTKNEIIDIRRQEAMRAAEYLGAHFHASIADDLGVFFTQDMISKATAKVREIQPDVMLLTSLFDYMEDHMNAARIGYTAAFARGMKNYVSEPPREPFMKDVVVYHALPYGLVDMINRPVIPDFFIDIERVLEKKRRMLACHESQKRWLDQSQGMDAYLNTMEEQSGAVGRMSGRFSYSEGWKKHAHLGFCSPDARPLEDFLQDYMKENS